MSAPVLPPRSILEVAEEVVAQLRENERMSDAIDAYAPGHENVHVRWLSKLRGYEVTVRFDEVTFDSDTPGQREPTAIRGGAVKGTGRVAPPGSA